jgi:uncharacterized membrane protein
MALPKHAIETSLREFFKATIAGGLLFLLPMVLILTVLRHAIQRVGKLTKPIADLLPFEAVLGVRRETFLAVVLLIFISLVAGLFAKTKMGRRFIHWCENSFLSGLPQYQLMKSMGEGLARVESAETVQPALVSIEDGWQIAYLLERLENGWVAVFLPQAPTPMSGNVMYLPAGRVRLLDITMAQARAIVKHIGIGSAEALRSADLRLPAGAGA